MWMPPWRSRALGYFTSPKTVEYRLTRKELSAIFDRSEDSVPHGFCYKIGQMVSFLHGLRGEAGIDLATGWGVIEADPDVQKSAEERATRKSVVATDLIKRINADRRRWILRGGKSSDFDELKVCVQIDDPELGRPSRVDIRAHERLHAKVLAREKDHDARLMRFLVNLFGEKGENRFLPVKMREYAVAMKWSAHGNNIEEVLARVAGYEAALKDVASNPKKAVAARGYFETMTSQYGGRDFTEFREALRRTGYTPARVLREA